MMDLFDGPYHYLSTPVGTWKTQEFHDDGGCKMKIRVSSLVDSLLFESLKIGNMRIAYAKGCLGDRTETT